MLKPTFKYLWAFAFLRWCVLSACSFLAVLGLTSFLHEICGLEERISFALPLVVAFFGNFLWLRYLLYGRPVGDWRKQFAKYAVAAIFFRSCEFAAYAITLDWLHINYILVAAIVLPGSFILKFVFYKL